MSANSVCYGDGESKKVKRPGSAALDEGAFSGALLEGWESARLRCAAEAMFVYLKRKS